MRRVVHLAGWAILGLSALVSGMAWAQRGELRVVNADRQAFRWTRGMGQLVVTDSTGSPYPLPVVRYHAHVLLHPPVALVQIDQTFYNPLPSQAEGTFLFNLPHGASVSRFAMFVTPATLMEGELVDRHRASDVYERIVYQRWDPGILEQVGANLFKMRVFPIPAADTKRVLLDYTLPLESDDGQYRFVLSLPTEGEPIWDFRVTGAIRGAVKPDSVVCESHSEVEIQRKDKQPIRFGWKKEHYRPSADLVLRFSEPLGSEPRLWAYTAAALRATEVRVPLMPEDRAGQAATYFHVSIPPQVALTKRDAPPPADVVVLAETSALVSDPKAVRQAVAQVLEGLRPEDRFRLGCVDVVQRWLTSDWRPATGPERQSALRRFDEGVFLGALDLNAALHEGAKVFSSTPPGRRRLLIYVGSATLAEEGQWFTRPTREQTLLALEPAILELSRAGCSFLAVIPVRHSPGEERLMHVAQKVGGVVFPMEFQRGREELHAWLAAGLPTPEPILELSVKGAREEDLFAPTGWVPGRALTVLGRCEPTASIQLKLVVMREGKPVVRQWKLAVDSKPDDVFVGRLWAQRKIEQLLRQKEGMAGGLASAPRREIVELSQEWSLLTPYTAFLVLESEADYARWDVPRQLRRRYWSPPEALEPLPLAGVGPFGPTGPKPEAIPPHAEQVQRSAVANAVRQARQALAAGDDLLAQAHLNSVAHLPAAHRSAEYQGMVREVSAVRWRQAVLEALGPHRTFFVPGQSELSAFVPDLSPLVQPLAPREFLQNHPYAYRLLRPIPVEPRRVSVQVLANLLAEHTGTNVVVDRKALDDYGVAVDHEFEVRAWGRMSLREYVRRALDQQALVLVEEAHRLVVTTQDGRSYYMALGVYAVRDLVHLGCTADVSELGAPYLDAELAAQKRLRERLRRPVTFNYRNAPLTIVLADVARILGDNVFVDLKAMGDAGIKQDSLVSGQWRDVPLGEALKWLLRPVSLDAVVHGETLIITTPEQSGAALLTTRVHSCRGLLYALKPEVALRQGIWGWWPGSGMGGGHFTGLEAVPGFGLGGAVRGMGRFGGTGGMAPPSGGFFGAASSARMESIGGFAQGAMPGRAGRGGPSPRGSGVQAISSGGEAIELPSAAATPPGPPFAPSALAAQEKPAEKPAPVTPAPEQPAPGPAPPTQTGESLALAGWIPGLVGPSRGPQTLIDSDMLADAIISTIAPTSWSEVGGPADIRFFYPTLDLVVHATDDVHGQIEELLERLRKLRPSAATLADYLPAEKIIDTADRLMRPDLDTLIDVITSQVRPTEWDEVGGPCSIRDDPLREALVVSAPPDMHDEIRHLLTLLRRSRYEALRGSRPWEGGGGQEPWVRPRQGPALSTQVALARLPEPEPAELQLLAVRRQPMNIRAQWRRIDAQGKADRLAWHLSGGRLQMELPGWTIRTEEDHAAVAYPTLQLVELGPWGESARRVLDAWFPWLPHRSNAELARLFQINPAPAQPEDAAKGIVRLRFTLPDYVDPRRAWIDAAFSKGSGQIVGWESWFDGRLAQRLYFLFDPPEGPAARLREVRLENSAGKTLARWELVAAEPEAAIPALEQGWDTFLRLDHRAENPQVDRDFARGIQHLRAGEWENAARHLRAALEARPRHPLVLLLLAYAVQQDKLPVPHGQVISWLAAAVESPAADLARFMAQGDFPGLSPVETYELLARQPAAQRTAADWERLAYAAFQAERYEQALAHAQSAIAAYKPQAHPWSLEKTRLWALLALGNKEQASALVAAWNDKWPGSPIDRLEAADRLAAHGLKEQAQRVYDQALAAPGLGPTTRADLLRRRADVQVGLARWRSLLEAAHLTMQSQEKATKAAAKDARQGQEPAFMPLSFNVLLSELDHAADAAAAATLAAEAKHPLLRTYLLIRRAQLTPDPQVAAQVLEQAANLGPLPDEFVPWACSQWIAAGRHAMVIRELEGRLRTGKRLWESELALLEQAYRTLGREQDALRAASSRSLGYWP